MAHTELRHDLRRCLPFIRPHGRSVGVVLAVTLVSGCLPALEPLGLRAIFDRLAITPHPTARSLLGAVCFLVGLWVARWIFEQASVLLAWRVRLAINHSLLAETTARLHRLPLSYHQGHSVGETMTRVD